MSGETRAAPIRRRAKLMVWLTMMAALIVVLTRPTSAMFNCLTPGMFKMNKGNQLQPYGGAGVYPPSHMSYAQAGPYAYGGGGLGALQNPMMRMLLQPKWKGGSSLFGGGRAGWNSWKANSNLYRPQYGAYQPNAMNPMLLAQPYSGASYDHLSQQLNLPSSAYGASSPSWSAPLTTSAYNQASGPIQQSQLTTYDSFTPLPPPPPQSKPLLDSYAGGGGATKGATKYSPGTTKNSILQANGGYGIYSDALAGRFRSGNLTYGYTYPDWYTGSVESPAKIAQQLMRFGSKGGRLRQIVASHQSNLSAPLRLATAPSAGQFTILDEPRFVGYGTVDLLTNKEARLSCSFNEAIDLTDRPLWIKFSGSYNSSRPMESTTKTPPPFNCESSQCRTQEVESTKDYRYKFDNGPATSTLIIAEPRLSDYGVYRCSALTKAIGNNPLETIYQIVNFGNL